MLDDDQREPDRDEVILDAVTRLIAKPVYEKSKLQVNYDHRHYHCNRNAERSDSRQKSEYQTEAAEELGGDGQVGERCGYTKLIAKCLDRSAQAMTAEPTQ